MHSTTYINTVDVFHTVIRSFVAIAELRFTSLFSVEGANRNKQDHMIF